MDLILLYIGIAAVAGFAIWVYIKLYRMYSGPDGERIQRRRAQGNFVPLSEADIAEDRARASTRSSD